MRPQGRNGIGGTGGDCAAGAHAGGKHRRPAPRRSRRRSPRSRVTSAIWTYPQGDDETSLKAYKAAFEELYPDVNVKISVVPEDTYGTKVNTALQAHKPPDIAVMEDRGWMKAGRVLDLTPYYASWGVDVADFNPGGIARATVEGDVADGVYGVGDFLGGNIFVYNKAMFDAAGMPVSGGRQVAHDPGVRGDLPQARQARHGPHQGRVRLLDARVGSGHPEQGRVRRRRPPGRGQPQLARDGRGVQHRGRPGAREGGARRDRADRDRRVRPVRGGPARDHLDGLHRDPQVRGRGPRVRARPVPRDQARGVVRGHLDGAVGHVHRVPQPGRGARVPALAGHRRPGRPDGDVGRPAALDGGRRGEQLRRGGSDQGGLPAGPLGGRPAAGLRAPGRRGLGPRRRCCAS